MKSISRARGMGAVGVIAIIVAVVVVLGAAAYFLSDVWSTKMDAAYDQFAHWTPENIAKDPLNYLNFCETQAKEALDKLKAADIRVAQEKGKVENMKQQAEQKVRVAEMHLPGLKQAFKAARDNGGFPIKFRDESYDEDGAKRLIVRLDKQYRAEQETVAMADKALKKLETQVEKIQQARDDCNDQLRTIQRNRTNVELQKISDDLQNQLVSMKGVLQNAVAVGASSETISLDSLAEAEATTVSDDEFEKILGN